MNQVAKALTDVLSDTYLVYMKTHAYHWNVEGPHFAQLHNLFEEQYTDMWTAIDEIAERIRELREYAPSSYGQMAQLSNIKEESGVPDARQMVANLVEDNETLVNTLKVAVKAAEENGDDATADMMIARTQIHEKYIWMMRSFLK
jgi:starvation-inducible DNA-binding protein